MGCCGQAPRPIKVTPVKATPFNPRVRLASDHKQASHLSVCKVCGSTQMLVIIAGRERIQCTNPECKVIER